MQTLLQFVFRNGKNTNNWNQQFVVTQSAKDIDYATLEDGIVSYMESNFPANEKCKESIEKIMNESGYCWGWLLWFNGSIDAIHTFWI